MKRYAVKSAPDGTEAEVTLLIPKKTDAGAKAAPANRQCLAFTTNLPRPSVAGMLADLPRGCRKRLPQSL